MAADVGPERLDYLVRDVRFVRRHREREDVVVLGDGSGLQGARDPFGQWARGRRLGREQRQVLGQRRGGEVGRPGRVALALDESAERSALEHVEGGVR